MAKFYLTTAIPYVNARPHVGHALEYIQADVVHRYHEWLSDDVHFISGADENAIKNVQAAEREGIDVQQFLERNSDVFRQFYSDLGVKLDEFRRGTDQKRHWSGVQELWKQCEKAGDIYKKSYKGLYCTGCEQFYQPKDLIDGRCPTHLRQPETVEEENYFFRLTNYQKQLEQLIESSKLRIIPEHRKNEVLSFVQQGLEDFSISRTNERARGVGVPVPGDDSQKMYVWFDALTIYMTAVGYGYDQKLWETWWPADLHVIGKDIIRFHCVYWPAMLLSAKLPLPKTIFSHGFITSGGQKMSKSLGNVIDPYNLISRFGVDALRYYLLREIPPFDDGDLTVSRFEEVYQSDLANGLGNLVQRVAKLCEKFHVANEKVSRVPEVNHQLETAGFTQAIERFEFNIALEEIWRTLRELDRKINEDAVWEPKAVDPKGHVRYYRNYLLEIAERLKLFLPTTSERILNILKGPKIKAPKTPLFPRIASVTM